MSCIIHVSRLIQVGGIKEKVLAAHRAGIGHVILPRRNEKDLKELPKGVKVRKRRILYVIGLIVGDFSLSCRTH